MVLFCGSKTNAGPLGRICISFTRWVDIIGSGIIRELTLLCSVAFLSLTLEDQLRNTLKHSCILFTWLRNSFFVENFIICYEG